MSRSRSISIATTLAAAAALTACGGGGGGDDTATRLPASAAEVTGDFDSSNYAEVAAGAATTLTPTGALANMGVSVLAQAASVTGDRASALDGEQRRRALRVQAQEVYQDTESCPGGGSLSYVINDADNNDDYSAGDSWSETYSNCNIGGMVLNGTAGVTVRSASSTGIDVAVSINQLSIGDAVLHGTGGLVFSVSGSQYAATVTFASMSLAASGAETVTLGHTTSFSYNEMTGVSTLALEGPVLVGSDSFWLDQAASFTLPAGKNVPRSGDLTILDKDGDRVVVVGTAQGLRYDFYKKGSNTPDASQLGIAAD